MRYKRGSRIEVMLTNEVPYCSWWCAEIISGNGHNYTIKYDGYPGLTNEAVVERVSRKSIRPSPPPVEFEDSWVPGEVMEVFHNQSWKMATVSKALGWNRFLVRLVGSFQEFEVTKYDLRVRQSWQDGQWSVIGKVTRNCEDEKQHALSRLKCNQNPKSQSKRRKAGLHGNNFQESRLVSSKTLKRGSPCCYSQVELNEGVAQKFRVAENDGRCHRVLTSSPEKVDAAATTKEMLCENHMHTAFGNTTTRLCVVDGERDHANAVFGCSQAISLEPYDAESITSSVGSCSITSHKSYDMPCQSGRGKDVEDDCNEAESVFQVGYEECISLSPSHEELAAEVHRLELQAYRSTMEALHASGPLSWEKETMVTNLRMSLHISNDEHLMELKHIISSATSIPDR